MENHRKYVSWIRVSTEGQSKSGLGLAAQESIIEYFMRSKPEQTFSDTWSGTDIAGAPNLRKAIEFCKETGYLLVVAKTDRFRNVQQALAIMDEIGEGNIHFCDLPTTNRMILTVMFAVYENQAIIGRINTKRALAEIKANIKKDGAHRTKDGKYIENLGNPKGTDTSRASEAAAIANKLRKERDPAWSAARSAALRWQAKGWDIHRIVEELNALGMKTRRGNPWKEQSVRNLLK